MFYQEGHRAFESNTVMSPGRKETAKNSHVTGLSGRQTCIRGQSRSCSSMCEEQSLLKTYQAFGPVSATRGEEINLVSHHNCILGLRVAAEGQTERSPRAQSCLTFSIGWKIQQALGFRASVVL